MAALTLGGIRDYVRLLLDEDSDDLPDLLLDRWIAEGDMRIRRRLKNWKWLDGTFTFATTAGTAHYSLVALGVTQVQSLQGPQWGPMQRRAQDTAEAEWFNYGQPTQVGEPYQWSVFGTDTLTLWPCPNGVFTITGRGTTVPTDWMAGGAGASPQMPSDLVETLVAWVLHKAYLWTDDPDLSAAQKATFDEGLAEFERTEQQAEDDTPIVLNRDACRTAPWDRAILPYIGI